jgi:hypothetical protein
MIRFPDRLTGAKEKNNENHTFVVKFRVSAKPLAQLGSVRKGVGDRRPARMRSSYRAP